MQPNIMPAQERLVTAEEFARIPNDDYHYELIEGRVVRMSPPGSRHRGAGDVDGDAPGGARRRATVWGSDHVGRCEARCQPYTVIESISPSFDRIGLLPLACPTILASPTRISPLRIMSPVDRPAELHAKVSDYLPAASSRLDHGSKE